MTSYLYTNHLLCLEQTYFLLQPSIFDFQLKQELIQHKIIKHEHPTRNSISGFAASLYFMTKYYQPRVFVNLRWPGPDFHLRGAFSSSPFQTARNFVMLASNLELNFSFEGLQSTSVQKCTYLDARLRLVNGMKCPAKS